jgi:hypothetical protein
MQVPYAEAVPRGGCSENNALRRRRRGISRTGAEKPAAQNAQAMFSVK